MSESRAIAAFTGLGVVLVATAVAVSHFSPRPGPVDLLPAVPTATAVVPPGISSAPPGPMSRGAPKMLQHPSLSRTQIAFDYAGEIWVVAREGGEAHRVVTGQLRNSRPVFSPDGAQIAFSGIYDGNEDVYVVPAGGGEARRITHHPGPDEALGWTPDGTKLLFRSWRSTPRDLSRLFTVPLAVESSARSSSPCPPATRPRCHPTERTSRTSRRSSAGARVEEIPRRPDDADLAGRPVRLARHDRSRAPTPTTGTPCGSATRSTSSRIATARRRCSPSTRRATRWASWSTTPMASTFDSPPLARARSSTNSSTGFTSTTSAAVPRTPCR